MSSESRVPRSACRKLFTCHVYMKYKTTIYIVTSLWETALRVFIREHYSLGHILSSYYVPETLIHYNNTTTKMLPVGTGIVFSPELLSCAVGILFCQGGWLLDGNGK